MNEDFDSTKGTFYSEALQAAALSVSSCLEMLDIDRMNDPERVAEVFHMLSQVLQNPEVVL